jgi:hypothetical protein
MRRRKRAAWDPNFCSTYWGRCGANLDSLPWAGRARWNSPPRFVILMP